MSGPLLVTGGTGYLGAELLRQAAGRPLVATWHSREPDEAAGVDWRRLDVRDATAVRSTVAEVAPSTVIHTAYKQSGEGAREITVDGAQSVAVAAREAGARLVHMSTDIVFDGKKGSPYGDDDPPSPIIDYGRAKAAAEEAVRAASPAALIVRTSLVYGGDGQSRHERTILEVARGEREMPFFVDEIRSPVQVGDLASALLELSEHDLSGVLHLAGADDVSRHELACLVARSQGVDPERLVAASSAETGIPRPANCALDSSRARSLLRTPLRGVYDVLGPSRRAKLLASFDAWTAGDLAAAARHMHPDIEWRTAGAMLDLDATYHGPDRVISGWRNMRAAWADIRIAVEHVIERGDEAIVYARFLARARDGMRVDHPLLWHVHFRGELADRLRTYWDRAEGERALGLEPLAD